MAQRKMQYKHMFDGTGDTEEPLGYQVDGPPIVVLTHVVFTLNGFDDQKRKQKLKTFRRD